MTIAILDANYAFNWQVSISREKFTNGRTFHGIRLIKYSKLFLETSTRDEIINTIKHECAHAIAGPHAKHGPIWRRTFIYLGGDGARQSQQNATQAAIRKAKRDNPLWIVSCPTCNVKLGGFNRKPTVEYKHKACRTPIVLTRTR